MVFKLTRALWAISFLCVFTTLMYVYSSLPMEQVRVQETPEGNLYLTRDVVFYIALAFILTINVFIFIVGAVTKSKQLTRTWFNGLVILLNVFTMISLFTLNAINSDEKYDFSRIGFFLYASLGLIAFWALTFPLWAFYQKKNH